MTFGLTPYALGPYALSGGGLSPPTPVSVSISASGSLLTLDLSTLPQGVYRIHVGPTGTAQDLVAGIVGRDHATELTVPFYGVSTVTIATPVLSTGGSNQIYIENVRGGGTLLTTLLTVLPRQAESRTGGVRRLLLPRNLNVGKLKF